MLLLRQSGRTGSAATPDRLPPFARFLRRSLTLARISEVFFEDRRPVSSLSLITLVWYGLRSDDDRGFEARASLTALRRVPRLLTEAEARSARQGAQRHRQGPVSRVRERGTENFVCLQIWRSWCSSSCGSPRSHISLSHRMAGSSPAAGGSSASLRAQIRYSGGLIF